MILLKKWETPTSDCYATTEVAAEEDEEFPQWQTTQKGMPKFGDQLTKEQRKDIQEMLTEFKDVLQETPGRTTLAKHSINTGTAQPVRLPPYRVPHHYRKDVQKELDQMVKSGIIEPSHSEWSSPLVIVKKKDGNLRLCVDLSLAQFGHTSGSISDAKN